MKQRAIAVQLAALAFCALATSGPVRAAEVHLRGHWVQPIEDEERFVGVLSRDAGGAAVSVELHLEAFRDGIFVGEEVRQVALSELVKLFSFPLENGIDCYQVADVVGFDAEGGELSAEDSSPEDQGACGTPDLVPAGASRPI
ncbi:hypothetical protein [Pseudomonas sp. LFM046]|uniref:hypothetical protein n=1 Tax=Pseudomonas sp. LFM046 TaxID=1608357 RepID=UPI000B00058D|nr:hypothetical protein [Pseudomonas sp. LFM046]